MLPSFTYQRATSVDDAVERLQRASDPRVHAGGTDLLGCLHDGVFGAGSLVSLSGLDELRGIRSTADGGLRIGALTTIRELAADATIRDRWTALAEAADVVASPQLRAQGTLGGNLCQKPRCWYYRGEFDCLRKGGDTCFAFVGQNEMHCIFGGEACYIVHPSDTAPALIALDAVVRIAGPGGRRSLPVAKLHVPPADDPQREVYLDPGEIVTEIVLPAPPAGLRSSYHKVRARQTWDFALAGAGVALALDGDVVRHARVVLSGVAPVPWRATRVEEVLLGSKLDDDTIALAAEAAVADAEPLEHNGYKVPLTAGVVRQRLEALRG